MSSLLVYVAFKVKQRFVFIRFLRHCSDVCYQGVCQNQDNSEESPDGRNMRVRSRLSDTGCTCAEGWHGPQCQLNSGDNTASKTCPDGETMCLNGSTCVKVLNEEAENVDSRKHLYR